MSTSTSTKIGHGLAKVLGIKLRYRNPTGKEDLSRGESVFSVDTADTYVEEEPTSIEWLREVTPSGRGLLQYAYNLFPFVHWIGRYNGQWLLADLIAGVTVGAVVVPQGMAYAALAELKPQFGLYSSFMGVLIYWFFATSKDITIGPVAVLSQVTGNVVLKVAKSNPSIPANVVASALAIIAGAIVCFIGLVRCGWIVDFISLAAISAFMTGSALNIAVGQVPTLMGITGFSTRDPTYLVTIHTLQHLGRSTLDAAMGLTALAMLYIIRSACQFAARRMPKRAKLFFFLATLRTVFVILLYTLISYLVNRNHRKKPKFKILLTVPRGFQNAAVPTINTTIIKAFAADLPVAVIVLLIEHIAISKSFGRVNNYTIDPSQEMVAIGVTNLLGPFLGAYPATGSFSRTAIKSKAGVRTPFAGVITAIVVLLAIYALPAVFFYVPSATLSAVIIHAVGDLITPPNTVYQFWRISPLEVGIFFIGVIVTVFSSIENGIYTTICLSLAILLFRVVKARGRFLGKVKVHSVIGDHLLDHDAVGKGPNDFQDPTSRNIFLPIEHHDGSNPQVDVESPYPGIFIYRFSEGYNYPNANHYLDYMVTEIFKQTRRTNPNAYPKLGDRPWNDPGPRRGQAAPDHSDRPTLKAIILDFSSVNNVDITSVQHLIDVRNQLDRYTAPERVEWHLACINNRWTKRALASAGFGYPSPEGDEQTFERWKPVFSVAEIGGDTSAAAAAEYRENEKEIKRQRTRDTEHGLGKDTGDHINTTAEAASSSSGEDFDQKVGAAKAYTAQPGSRVAVVHGLNRPLFHIDLTSALQSAITNTERRGGGEPKGVGTL
ncbi:Sulfate permease 2 [Bachmanniomyces sp. S44760]|nr:Sulfate permease 2 [Bachmanniomyces sp. S44760]